MPDWEILIRERLGKLDLPPEQQSEIVVELAAHMDDFCEAQRAQGFDEDEATRRTLHEVTAWRRLAREIYRKKRKEGVMNHRTKSLWIPGLVSLTAASGLLAILLWAGLQSRFLWATKAAYVVWILMLPLCGAAGAHLSRRAGGQKVSRIVAGMFPSVTMLLALGFVFFVALFVEHNRYVLQRPTLLLLPLLGWIVLPGMLLSVGTIPFLRDRATGVVASN